MYVHSHFLVKDHGGDFILRGPKIARPGHLDVALDELVGHLAQLLLLRLAERGPEHAPEPVPRARGPHPAQHRGQFLDLVAACLGGGDEAGAGQRVELVVGRALLHLVEGELDQRQDDLQVAVGLGRRLAAGAREEGECEVLVDAPDDGEDVGDQVDEGELVAAGHGGAAVD